MILHLKFAESSGYQKGKTKEKVEENRRDRPKVKRQATNNGQSIHEKLKIDHHEADKKQGVTSSFAPEVQYVLASLEQVSIVFCRVHDLEYRSVLLFIEPCPIVRLAINITVNINIAVIDHNLS